MFMRVKSKDIWLIAVNKKINICDNFIQVKKGCVEYLSVKKALDEYLIVPKSICRKSFCRIFDFVEFFTFEKTFVEFFTFEKHLSNFLYCVKKIITSSTILYNVLLKQKTISFSLLMVGRIQTQTITSRKLVR